IELIGLRVQTQNLLLFCAVDVDSAVDADNGRFQLSSTVHGGDDRFSFWVDDGDRAAVTVDDEYVLTHRIKDNGIGIFVHLDALDRPERLEVEDSYLARAPVIGKPELCRRR